jgi:AcrR family transcriptional regulator
LELLEDKPLDKITVREIVEECGVSRNTFYYHFHDIYELIEEMFNNEVDRIMRDANNNADLSWVFREVCQISSQHSMAMYHLCHSSDHDRVMGYLHNASMVAVRQVVERHAEGIEVAQSDIELICSMIASIVEGISMGTISAELTDPDELDRFVTRICQLLDGVIDLTLVNATRNWENPVYVGYSNNSEFLG